MNQLTNIQKTMSSREIADQTGKQHRHVLDAIRKMETAWTKVNGSSFRLVEYTDAKGEKRPMYELTKKECLYISTKFNDEQRARVINRWEQLEQTQIEQPKSDAMVLASAFQILNNMVESQKEEIAKLTPKADYVDKIVSSDSYFTTTQVGAQFGLSAIALHKFLSERGVIRRMSDGEYIMLSRYMNKGYEYYKPVIIHAKDMTKRQLCWTELGRAFIHNLIDPFKRVQSTNDLKTSNHA